MKNKIMKKVIPALCTLAIGLPIISLSSCDTKSKDSDPSKPTIATTKIKNSKYLNDINMQSINEPLTCLNESKKAVKCSIQLLNDTYYNDLVLQYKLINSSIETQWVEVPHQEGTTDVSIPAGEAIQFRAKRTTDGDSNLGRFSNPENTGKEIKITLTNNSGLADDKQLKLGGSLSSLLCNAASGTTAADEWIGCTELHEERSKGCFQWLFDKSECIRSVSPSLLPFTTLAEKCYLGMFSGCNNLSTAPILPAKKLAAGCYYSMFYGCWMLPSISLPARTLAYECYRDMLDGCSGINTIYLGYVGNFSDEYFHDWVKDFGSKEEAISRTIYYCGEDKTVSNNALPKNFTVKTMDNILAQTKVLTFTEDQYKTGTLPSGAQNTVRAYNDQTFGELNIDKQIIPQYKDTKGDLTEWYGVESGTFKKIDDINDKQVQDLPSTTLAPKFGVSEPTEIAEYTQLSVVENAQIKLGYKATGDKVELAEYIKGQEPSFNEVTTTDLTPLIAGKTYILKGNISNTAYGNNTNIQIIKKTIKDGYSTKTIGKVRLVGSALSLIRDNSGIIPTTLPDFAFANLFKDSTAIISVSPNYLRDKDDKSVAVSKMCYASMFEGCTNLVMQKENTTSKPAVEESRIKLDATASKPGCYYKMFEGCTSIIDAPVINFSEEDKLEQHVSSRQYYGVCAYMFEGCTSLVSADYVLKPKKLSPAAYSHMFAGCTALTKAPQINAYIMNGVTDDIGGKYDTFDNTGEGCCGYMFKSCKNLVDAAAFVSTEDEKNWKAGAYAMRGMYYMGDMLKHAPILKFRFESNATCVYSDMFKFCRQLDVRSSQTPGLVTVKFLATSDLGSFSGGTTGTAQQMFGYTKDVSGWERPTQGYTYYYVQ